MVTQNYKNILKDMLQIGSRRFPFGAYPIKSATNVTFYTSGSLPVIDDHTYVYGKVTKTTMYGGVVIGSGNTEATVDDYWLENQISSGFDGRVIEKHYMDNNGNSTVSFIVFVVNTSQSNITINEIGYAADITCCSIQGAANYTHNTDAIVLLDRSVLDSPFVIEPGKGVKIEYMLKTVNVVGQTLPPAQGVSF